MLAVFRGLTVLPSAGGGLLGEGEMEKRGDLVVTEGADWLTGSLGMSSIS